MPGIVKILSGYEFGQFNDSEVRIVHLEHIELQSGNHAIIINRTGDFIKVCFEKPPNTFNIKMPAGYRGGQHKLLCVETNWDTLGTWKFLETEKFYCDTDNTSYFCYDLETGMFSGTNEKVFLWPGCGLPSDEHLPYKEQRRVESRGHYRYPKYTMEKWLSWENLSHENFYVKELTYDSKWNALSIKPDVYFHFREAKELENLKQRGILDAFSPELVRKL